MVVGDDDTRGSVGYGIGKDLSGVDEGLVECAYENCAGVNDVASTVKSDREEILLLSVDILA